MSNRYQCCPKCNGQGIVSKPPWVPGDASQWTAADTIFKCPVCQGNKVLPVKEGE